MSVYFVKRKKKWRYDFTLKGIRYTEAWFNTKTAAKQAEARKREELINAVQFVQTKPIRTDTDFLTLCNKRLDHVKNNHSDGHFKDVFYRVKRWVKEWNGLYCSEISDEMIMDFVLERKKVSVDTANNEIRHLRATFNFGIKKNLISFNPTDSIDFFPVSEKEAYLPPLEDVYKIIRAADPDTQDYLLCIVFTAARVNEINSLEWNDVDFKKKEVTLWTRKNKNGDRKYRKIPMVPQLYELLKNRYKNRESDKPSVFWHTYWSRKSNCWVSGTYGDRSRIMVSLCKKASVKYFKFHPFRHFTATILDSLRVPIRKWKKHYESQFKN